MDKVRNVIEQYKRTWIIFAKKRLSNIDKLNAVNNFIAINEDNRAIFMQNQTIMFDIDEMKPLAADGKTE